MTAGERAAAERLRQAIKEFLVNHKSAVPERDHPPEYWRGWKDAMFGAALNIYVVKIPEEGDGAIGG